VVGSKVVESWQSWFACVFGFMLSWRPAAE
jgi:hypothetical protein